MSTRCTAIVLSLAVIAAASMPAVADEAQDAAGKYADQMIERLSAFKINATRTNLEEKKEQYGATPGYATAWGLLLASEGKLDDGLEQLGKAAAAAPKDPAPEIYRATVYEWKRDAGKAKSSWESARNRAKAQVDASPDDARAQYYLGTALVGLKNYSEARTHLQKALEKGYDTAMVQNQIGVSYSYEGKWNEAKAALDAAIAADDRFAYAYYFRGRVWDKLGRKDNMLIDLDQFVKLAPNAPDAAKAKAILAAAGR